MNSADDIVLGDNVTHLAAPKSKRGTVMLSLRLPVGEFAELEAASMASNKTVSEVVREAIRAHLDAGRRVYVVSDASRNINLATPHQKWDTAAASAIEPREKELVYR
jgi:hypothetical protein